MPESLDPTFIQNKVVVAGKENVIVVSVIVILKSLNIPSSSFTLFSHVGWLKFHDVRNVDIRFHGMFNGATASEGNRIFLGILPGIFSMMISMVVIIKGIFKKYPASMQ